MMRNKKGFTLLELLIVIAILAFLGAIVVFFLNPAETLRKARDSQRISDLSTIKTALGIYIASKTSPLLDNVDNEKCVGGAGQDTLYLSVATAITDNTPPPGFVFATTTVASSGLTNGTGWLPINLASLTGGSPISSMPVDPSNTVNDVANVTSSSLIYRYACKKSPLGFEVNARLESDAFGPGGEDDRAIKDGGNNPTLYEVGTDLITILPSTGDF